MRNGLRILYAEDQAFMAEAMRIELEESGHTVEIACDGLAALDRIARGPTPFDLVITDHQMPRLDGLGLVIALRKLKFPGRLIVYSSRVEELQLRSYHDLRVDRIEPKTSDPAAMVSIIADLFRQPPTILETAVPGSIELLLPRPKTSLVGS